jgi:threonine aldolase
MGQRGFASDNNSGIHPQILRAIESSNMDHAIGYGDDQWTNHAIDLFKNEFGSEIDVFFMLTGTGANILSIQSAVHSFHSILCASTAHIYIDECGAPEKFTGSKLIPIATKNGKLTPELIQTQLHGFGFEHHSQPGLISITQVTELGTVYTPGEIKELADLAHKHGMYLHMDGARIANAAVSLGLSFKAFTKDVGVDILSFGGTKNGMMVGEAVIFLNPKLAKNSKYFRKQAAQLYSKMRFVGAQFVAYLQDELWKTNAMHANNMAKLLEKRLKEIEQIQITQPVQANGIFAIIPPSILEKLQEQYFFYTWDESNNEVRWMTSFDTTEEDINGFITLTKKLLAKQ